MECCSGTIAQRVNRSSKRHMLDQGNAKLKATNLSKARTIPNSNPEFPAKVFKCKVCSHPCKSRGGVKNHMRWKHTASEGGPTSNRKQNGPMVPNSFSPQTPVEVEANQTADAQEGQTLAQPNGRRFSVPVQESKINEAGNMVCNVCKEEFAYKTKVQKDLFKKHLEIHYCLRPFLCPFCKAAYRNELAVLRHVTVHTGKNNFDCPECQKNFKNATTLNEHMKTCKGGRKTSQPSTSKSMSF